MLRASLIDEYREDNLYCRIVELVSSSKRHAIMGPALSSLAPLKILEERMKSELQEIFVRVTLDDLRQIDGNKGRQDAFIKSHFRIHDSNSLTFTALKILVPEGEHMDTQDIEYIYDVLQYPGNDFMTIPLLYTFNRERPMAEKPCSDEYFSFLTMYCQMMKQESVNSIGLIVPSYVSGRKIDEAFEAIRDFATPFVGYDAHGRRAITSYPDVSRLRRLCREKEDEKYFLYAFDTKGYRQGPNQSAAEDLLELTYGISSFGPRHYNPPRRIPKPPPGTIISPKLVDSDSYTYTTEPNSLPAERFSDWAASHAVNISSQNGQYAYSKWFNNLSLYDMSRAVENASIDGNLTRFLTEKTQINSVVRDIMKKNRQNS